MDYIPQVSRDDVVRVVRRDIPAAQQADVLNVLSEYGNQEWHVDRDRVHLACLKNSDGCIDNLRTQVEMASQDYRDVLAEAEYPRFFSKGFVGVGRMSPDEIEKLQRDDWQEYQSWLLAAQSSLQTDKP